VIVLNHTIVPARDKRASARFFADVFGLDAEFDAIFGRVKQAGLAYGTARPGASGGR
jgi:hypothetical protein